MNCREQEAIAYIRAMLVDIVVADELPNELRVVDGMEEIDGLLRGVRSAVRSIGLGELSYRIAGKGYVIGVIKNLQAALKNLTWQTKAVASGDFSQRVDFLGEFSDVFNSMVIKLEGALHEVKEARDRFEMFFETIPDATMIMSMEDQCVFKWNRAFEEVSGCTAAELHGMQLDEVCRFTNEAQKEAFFDALRHEQSVHNMILELSFRSGGTMHGLVSAQVMTIGSEPYILSVIKDITELHEMEKRLKASEELHRMLADNANDVIWTMGLDGKFTYVSPSVLKLRGYTVEEVMAQSREELLCPSSVMLLENGLRTAAHAVHNNLPFPVFRGDVEQPCKDGTTVWTDLTVSGMYDGENRFVGMLGVTRDITERKRMEKEIRRLSETDRLTGLSNRLKLDEVLATEIEQSALRGLPCSIVLLDIDYFKRVNDTFGHLVGDTALQDVARMLIQGVRMYDTVGRWGGEEFMMILPGADTDDATAVAERVRARIAAHSFERVGKLTASFGVATTRGEMSIVELVVSADDALYRAKNEGRNRVARYTPKTDN